MQLQDFLSRVRIVLVGTQHPGNIGAAARAMRTMGLTRMVLVAPETAPNRETHAMAAGADDVVENAALHSTLAQAVGDCALVLGCTARSRRVALDELPPSQAAKAAWDATMQGREVALVFGRERTGLTNEELQLCHAAVHIPSDPEFSSLNLAAAVQVLSYALRDMAMRGGQVHSSTSHAVAADAPQPQDLRDLPAAHAELEGFFAQLDATLHAIDFHKGRTPDSAMRKLRRIYLRANLTTRELRLLRGILADSQRMARLAGHDTQPQGF